MKKLILIAGLLLGMSPVWAAQVCDTAGITASTPTADFVDNGDGTVTHVKTGLQWKKCAEGLSGAACTGTATMFDWQAALIQADTVNAGTGFAGKTDWRVPNIKELAALLEGQCAAPAINATLFPATPVGNFWTSTSASFVSFAIQVNFDTSADSTTTKATALFLRLVRGG